MQSFEDGINHFYHTTSCIDAKTSQTIKIINITALI